MLLEDKELDELFQMKHRHDDQEFVDWGNNLLNKSLSPYLYKNDLMNQFLTRIQSMTSIIIDQQNIMKNFKNYMVDKYFYKHTH